MQQNSSTVKKEKIFWVVWHTIIHTEATMQHSVCKDLYNRSQQDNCTGFWFWWYKQENCSMSMFPVTKLQQLHTEPLGFSQCKVVQAKLPNPSAILLNHSMAEHSPVNTLSSLESAIQHWPWLPAKLLIQQLSYGTRQCYLLLGT